MSGMLAKIRNTVLLIRFALLPATGRESIAVKGEGEKGAEQPPPGPESCAVCTPERIRGGFGGLLDDRGEISVCFPDCLAPAAPAVLFRLKREGFSECRVRATEKGLLVRGRR